MNVTKRPWATCHDDSTSKTEERKAIVQLAMKCNFQEMVTELKVH
jgi:hypothetical protein